MAALAMVEAIEGTSGSVSLGWSENLERRTHPDYVSCYTVAEG